jgi:hypothetical protein
MALKEKPIGAQNIEQLSFLWNALLAYFLFLEEVFFFCRVFCERRSEVAVTLEQILHLVVLAEAVFLLARD